MNGDGGSTFVPKNPVFSAYGLGALGLRVSAEPVQHSLYKFLRRNLTRRAMTSARNLPHSNPRRILCLDQIGVIVRNIAIVEPVDQQDRCFHPNDRLLRDNGIQVNAVSQANKENPHLQSRTKESPAEPWPGVKRPSETVISFLPKARRWRLGNHRAKPRFARQRFQ